MKKNEKSNRLLVLRYSEEEMQSKRIPPWMIIIFMLFALGALLFPFYA